MASASALLEVSHRVPSLDYSSLMALTWQLTKKADELLKLYTLMCFNVFAHTGMQKSAEIWNGTKKSTPS